MSSRTQSSLISAMSAILGGENPWLLAMTTWARFTSMAF
jgi:hypothetical protein